MFIRLYRREKQKEAEEEEAKRKTEEVFDHINQHRTLWLWTLSGGQVLFYYLLIDITDIVVCDIISLYLIEGGG